MRTSPIRTPIRTLIIAGLILVGTIGAGPPRIGYECRPAPAPAILLPLPSLSELAFVDVATHEIGQLDGLPGVIGGLTTQTPKRQLAFALVDSPSPEIVYFDLSCQLVVGQVALPSGYAAMTLGADGSKIYITDGAGLNVDVIAVDKQQIVQTVPLASRGSALAYSAYSHELFVVEGNLIGVISTRTGETEKSIRTTGCHKPIRGCEPFQLAAPGNGKYLFVAEDRGIAVYDAGSHKVVQQQAASGRIIGLDQALNGFVVEASYRKYATTYVVVSVMSVAPPFSLLKTWTIEANYRLSVDSVAFDSAGIGYATTNYNQMLFLRPDGSYSWMLIGTALGPPTFYR